MQFGGGDAAGEQLRAAARYRTGHLKLVWIGQRVCRENHRTQRAAGVVDLGLRQVQRILALNVPGRNVVGEGESGDAAGAAQHHGQFRFGRRELRIDADPDALPGPHAHARRAFEKNFRAGSAIHVRVHSLARAMLGVAEGGAGFISAAAAPHLRRMDGQRRIEGFRLKLRELAGQRPQGGSFGFGPAHQFQQGQSRNPTGHGFPAGAVFENRGAHRALNDYLPKMHRLVTQYFR